MNATWLALFYGDYPRLAARLLDSWRNQVQWSRVAEIRLACNAIGDKTRQFIRRFAAEVPVPIQVWEAPDGENRGKYPMLRELLRSPPITTDWVMWWDDDSYLTECDDWHDQLDRLAETSDFIGERWYRRLQGNMHQFVRDQPWRDPQRPVRYSERFPFPQGSWWASRTKLLLKWDWPPPALHHNGGDLLLGALLAHQQYRVAWFNEGLRLNADDRGERSKSPRRGLSQPLHGHDYTGQPYPPVVFSQPLIRWNL